jgi:hypothetical protein
MEQFIGVGLVLGVCVSFINETLTRLYLNRVLQQKWSAFRTVALLLVVGFYLLKYTVLGLGLYGLFVTLHLNLAGFALGVLLYQVYRVSRMIFASRTYSSQQHT